MKYYKAHSGQNALTLPGDADKLEPASALAPSEPASPSGTLAVTTGWLEPSASRPPVFIVKAWGDEIPHATEQAALAEISECLQLGATSVSVEVRESPAPANGEHEPRSPK